MKAVSVNPDFKYVSTSFVERQNWTVRTNMRRYTRLSNGFSRKLENHGAAVALNYFAYNFIKIHRTLRIVSGDGCWRHRSVVERRGLGCRLGSIRAAEGGKSSINDRSSHMAMGSICYLRRSLPDCSPSVVDRGSIDSSVRSIGPFATP
jgi:hypothetical protein